MMSNAMNMPEVFVSEPLGPAPADLNERQVAMWNVFVKEIPHLQSMHRLLVSVVVRVAVRLDTFNAYVVKRYNEFEEVSPGDGPLSFLSKFDSKLDVDAERDVAFGMLVDTDRELRESLDMVDASEQARDAIYAAAGVVRSVADMEAELVDYLESNPARRWSAIKRNIS